MTYNDRYIIVKLETSYDISDHESASVAAIGSHVSLGNWNENRPLLAINTTGNLWEIYISARAGTRIYWKWMVYDLKNKKILLSEDKVGVRELVVPSNDSQVIVPWNKAQNKLLPLSESPSCDLKGFTLCVNSEYIKSYHTNQPVRIYHSKDAGNTVVGAMALAVVFYSVYRRLF
ncbi:hypothetical protein ACJMK2_021644 [Sinanodonta woodiana]|uniref:CBM20 domain-containing protein n=1 Tax=Sinanodonta woodiana TaxID=1069815 RepID=A0ABD3THC8_SINWO